VTAVLIVALAMAWPAGRAAATPPLNTPTWSASATAAGKSGVSYTWTFKTTGGAATLNQVTMTVPTGTGGSPAVGTVTPPAFAAGASASLSGNTVTYSFTASSIKSGTPVSIQLTGFTNTSTAGSYTSVITTLNSGTTVQTGTTPALSFTAGALASPRWTASSTTVGATGVSYTYTFTTGTSSTLSQVAISVPAGTAGTPAVGTVTPAAVAAGGTATLSGTTLTYSFTPSAVAGGTAVSIQVTGLVNPSVSGTYTAQIVTVDPSNIDSGTTPPLTFDSGTLTLPSWTSTSVTTSATASYTYTFTTASTATLSSVTMTVPAGTAGTLAIGTVTPAAITTGAAVALSGTTLTYSFTGTSVNALTAVSIQVTGLVNTSSAGSYTSMISTNSDTGPIDSGTTPAVTFTSILTLTSPASLTWADTLNGTNQSVADTTAADEQLTVNDATGSGAGWHVTVSATTLTTGTHSLPNTGTLVYTGSVTSVAATTAPDANCVITCTLPTDTTTYPVAITTAGSSPPAATIYDTAAGTGSGAVTLGGSSAAHPSGWWVNVPGNTYVGTYTTTITMAVVSAP
jgi:hypothetical protein